MHKTNAYIFGFFSIAFRAHVKITFYYSDIILSYYFIDGDVTVDDDDDDGFNLEL